MPHPNFAPVRSSSSRRYQRRGTSPSPSNLRVCPLTVSSIIRVLTLYTDGARSQGRPKVLKVLKNARAYTRGKPWDRQPVSGKLRRKLGVSPGFAKCCPTVYLVQNAFTINSLAGACPGTDSPRRSPGGGPQTSHHPSQADGDRRTGLPHHRRGEDH